MAFEKIGNVVAVDWEKVENTLREHRPHWSWDEDARAALVVEKREARWEGWRKRRENILATL